MSVTKAPAKPEDDTAIDKRIASLMDEIQREPVPERLLDLARELQEALRSRTK